MPPPQRGLAPPPTGNPGSAPVTNKTFKEELHFFLKKSRTLYLIDPEIQTCKNCSTDTEEKKPDVFLCDFSVCIFVHTIDYFRTFTNYNN